MAIEHEDMVALESLVDRYSLAEVLRGLTTICYGKATHVAEAWQDIALAHAWERAGTTVDKCSCQKAIGYLP